MKNLWNRMLRIFAPKTYQSRYVAFLEAHYGLDEKRRKELHASTKGNAGR